MGGQLWGSDAMPLGAQLQTRIVFRGTHLSALSSSSRDPASYPAPRLVKVAVTLALSAGLACARSSDVDPEGPTSTDFQLPKGACDDRGLRPVVLSSDGDFYSFDPPVAKLTKISHVACTADVPLDSVYAGAIGRDGSAWLPRANGADSSGVHRTRYFRGCSSPFGSRMANVASVCRPTPDAPVTAFTTGPFAGEIVAIDRTLAGGNARRLLTSAPATQRVVSSVPIVD
jgi:hypothetical protein